MRRFITSVLLLTFGALVAGQFVSLLSGMMRSSDSVMHVLAVYVLGLLTGGALVSAVALALAQAFAPIDPE